MSTPATALPFSPSATGGPARRLVRRAQHLSWVTVAWMTIEAAVAIVAALVAGSVALLGFGLDSLIELTSAGTVLWRFTGGRSQSESAERRAHQLVAGCFFALAVYLLFGSIRVLAGGAHPDPSVAGVAVSIAAIIVMPFLGRAKNRVACQLNSAAVAGDASQSWLCAISAAGVLVSILANAALGAWWLDPIIALGIAALAVHEGSEAWGGKVCADCAPVGFDKPATDTCADARWA